MQWALPLGTPLSQRPGKGVWLGHDLPMGSVGCECLAPRWGPPEGIWGQIPSGQGCFSSKSFGNAGDGKCWVNLGQKSSLSVASTLLTWSASVGTQVGTIWTLTELFLESEDLV